MQAFLYARGFAADAWVVVAECCENTTGKKVCITDSNPMVWIHFFFTVDTIRRLVGI